MSFNYIASLISRSTLPATPPPPPANEPYYISVTRYIRSQSSYTKDDGTVVTTTRYSDNTIETTRSGGDSVTLSDRAKNLTAA